MPVALDGAGERDAQVLADRREVGMDGEGAPEERGRHSRLAPREVTEALTGEGAEVARVARQRRLAVGDGTREAYVGIASLASAVPLAQADFLSVIDAEGLMEQTSW